LTTHKGIVNHQPSLDNKWLPRLGSSQPSTTATFSGRRWSLWQPGFRLCCWCSARSSSLRSTAHRPGGP